MPREVRRRLGIQEGDYLRVEAEGDRIVMTPVAVVDRSQAYLWTPAWQKALAEAEEDIRRGRVREAKSVADLFASLEREQE